MPCTLGFSSGSRGFKKKSASPRVGFTASSTVLKQKLTLSCSFMADKIMTLDEAVEGYDLFDKMKAQKVIFEA